MNEQHERVPLSTLVEDARKNWLIKQAWFLTPWGQWRRGSVQYIGNDGLMLVLVYKTGTSGYRIWSHVEKIPDVLKPVQK